MMLSDIGFWLDFKNKVAFYGKKNHKGNCVPATEKERKAFITHFYSKGINKCTFKELKKFVDFHGVRIDGRIYATVHITNKYLYMDLLSRNDDIQRAIGILQSEAYAKTNESEIKQKTKIIVRKMLKSVLEEMVEQVDEVFKFY